MTMPGISAFPPTSYTVSWAVGLGTLPFVPTAAMRSPSTTTVVLGFGAWRPSIRFAPRKKMRPMRKPSFVLVAGLKLHLILAPYQLHDQACQGKPGRLGAGEDPNTQYPAPSPTLHLRTG